MKEYPSENIRNLTLVGHGGSGKTSLAEAALFLSGVVKRLGKTNDGNTTCDYDPDEIKRKISISSSLAPLEWNNHKINLIDTPGYADFIGDVISALRASDAALVTISAASGIEVQTEKVWSHASELGLPKVIFINRMDKEHANFYEVLESLRNLSVAVAPLQIPIGEEKSFQGVVDLVKMKAITTKEGGSREEEIPGDLSDEANKAREKLLDAIAETNDELLEKYLEGQELEEVEINTGLKTGILTGTITPVVCGSATNLTGVEAFLDTIVACLPSPADRGAIKGKNPKTDEVTKQKPTPDESLAALAFKTITDPYIGKLNFVRVYSGTLSSDSTIYNSTKQKKEKVGHVLVLRGKNQQDVAKIPAGDIAAIPKLEYTASGDTLCQEQDPIILEPIKLPEPVFSVAIEPKTKGDEEKLSTSLKKLAEEDVTLNVQRDAETKQTVVSGIGDLHLEIVLSRLKRKFDVEATLSSPKIPYRETIKAKAKAQGKYKKQTGGRGQYGDAWIEVAPLDRGGGFKFVDQIVGGSIPKGFIPAVEKGIKEALEKGIIAGYPLVDIKITLYDGSYHSVDSSEMAFKIAGSLAFKKAAEQAKPTLLEPVMNIEIVVPEEYTGDVIGDLSGKRGRVLGMEPRGKNQSVKAIVPLGEISQYATELRSLTHGKGAYSMEFFRYEEVPQDAAQKIISESKREEE